MIKFFRKIRYDLMGNQTSPKASAGKTGKYFKYAIGEIILVVIGILIALQINNWNEYRKDRVKEQAVLRQIKGEYQNNLKQLESKIHIREIIINSSQKIISYIDNSQGVPEDSILFNLSRGSYRPTFDPIKNDIISSNKLSLIKNDSLRKLLSQWESNVHQLNEEEWFWTKYSVDHRQTFMAENYLSRKMYYLSTQINKKLYLLEDYDENSSLFPDSHREVDLQTILEKPKLEAIMSTAIFSNTDGNLISGTLRKQILEILRLTNEHLNDKFL
jgi:hypothetical protein